MKLAAGIKFPRIGKPHIFRYSYLSLHGVQWAWGCTTVDRRHYGGSDTPLKAFHEWRKWRRYSALIKGKIGE